jgi:DUF3068 family protein
MRRPVGLLLVGLGAFLLTLAPLVRFYVASNLVAAPLNYYARTSLEARNATYFDLASQRQRTGATLAVAHTVRGDTRASSNNRDIAVWDVVSEIYDKDRKRQIEFQSYRYAFNRRSALLVNCCGTHVSGDMKVELSGYGLLFPIANVKKTDYPFFDITTKRSTAMRYVGGDWIHGRKVYLFAQTIPKYKVANVDYRLPGRMLNYGRKNELYKVERFFEAFNQVWVDPRTGIPVQHQQSITSTVETDGGKGSLTVAEARLTTVDADVRKKVAESNAKARQIWLLETAIPWGSLGAGLVLLLTGAALSMPGGGGWVRRRLGKRSQAADTGSSEGAGSVAQRV